MTTDARRQRCREGLADRALVGLATTEASALMDLAVQVDESDTFGFDRAAAAVALAGFGSRLRPMTAELAARAETQALEVLPTFVTGAPTEDGASILKGNTVLIPAITPAQIAAADKPEPAEKKVETRSAYGPPLRSLVALDAYADHAPPTSYAPMPGPLHAAFVHGPRPMPHAAPPMPMANLPEAPPPFAPPPPPVRTDSVTPRRGPSAGWAIAGWLVAVVLLVALGGALLLLRRSRAAPTAAPSAPTATSTPTTATSIPSAAPPTVVASASAAPVRTPADERQALLDEGVTKVDFARTKEAPVAAGGDLVWSQKEQRGYVKVHGLARNDPRAVQYQIWITDKGREDRYPVEGGIFDVDADGQALVAVTPRLTVKQPTAFAVTLERAGGVVVSKRDHLMLTARLPAP